MCPSSYHRPHSGPSAEGPQLPHLPISAQAWIPYRVGGCRSEGQRSHQSQGVGVLWGPHCTAVEDWGHVWGDSAAPSLPPFPSRCQTHQSLPLLRVPVETWGAPPQRAPAPASAHHRHSGDKREGHSGSYSWIWDGDSMGGDKITGEKQKSPLEYDSHRGENGVTGWKAVGILLRENGISMRGRRLWGGDIGEGDPSPLGSGEVTKHPPAVTEGTDPGG